MKTTTPKPKPAPSALPAPADDPRFLPLYCAALNGLASQFETYGHTGDRGRYGDEDDLFVHYSRGEDAESRCRQLARRAYHLATCALAELDAQPDEIEEFNAKL